MENEVAKRLADALTLLLEDSDRWLSEGVIAAGKGTRTANARGEARKALSTFASYDHAAVADSADVHEKIKQVLLNHRLANQHEGEDGGGYPLVDALTPTGAPSISWGQDEIDLLTDAIWNELTPVSPPESAVVQGEAANAAVAGGFVMVPRVPTPEMIEAVSDYFGYCDADREHPDTKAEIEQTWSAMLAASPTPPASITLAEVREIVEKVRNRHGVRYEDPCNEVLAALTERAAKGGRP